MDKKENSWNIENGQDFPGDYDSAWKDVIEELFKYFLKFFFPRIYEAIDFTKKIEFLSEELRKIVPDGKLGKRIVDVLAKVYLKGNPKYICLFIHIEVQGQPRENFMERMYVYNYRPFDKYREEGVQVISLAVLTDEDINYRPNEYIVSLLGFELRMKIPIVKIIDYKLKEDLRRQLETSANPMAMVVKAHLKSFEVKKEPDNKKSSVKWELMRQCYESGYSKKSSRILLKFIDWFIRLPDELEKQLTGKIIKFEEEYKMPYVTSWERIAEERGKKIGEEIGEERGEERGEEKGKLQTARELVKRGVDINIIAEATGFSREQIEKLATEVH
jgi:hypothetical protein